MSAVGPIPTIPPSDPVWHPTCPPRPAIQSRRLTACQPHSQGPQGQSHHCAADVGAVGAGKLGEFVLGHEGSVAHGEARELSLTVNDTCSHDIPGAYPTAPRIVSLALTRVVCEEGSPTSLLAASPRGGIFSYQMCVSDGTVLEEVDGTLKTPTRSKASPPSSADDFG